MKNLIFASLLLISSFGVLKGQSPSLESFFDQTDRFLKTHVKEGKIDYNAVKADKEIKDLISQIALTDLQSKTIWKRKHSISMRIIYW